LDPFLPHHHLPSKKTLLCQAKPSNSSKEFKTYLLAANHSDFKKEKENMYKKENQQNKINFKQIIDTI